MTESIVFCLEGILLGADLERWCQFVSDPNQFGPWEGIPTDELERWEAEAARHQWELWFGVRPAEVFA